ncbi:bifunctional phosphopantothenoylcysteine decarboxylase/phosphopantothenate--cysteine ligase CoaBC [[Haemophilus] felis]|uniref:Coenzyme A biosynthesis bifunctional protein CoaBC n=1 Tax=[Haemophilus] felis TaxID=123822 RepID=A0A1T0B580_9PAST|nr:bifunctional phosphopantothenoylcysteine decarboxylase/phosphopantothenate--cysteine ligase CoaBC [[Haemophilus] felis]NBI40571.1 bifunctional phosphopantothenoylcysteine decarboxylase/phosphopantothenate--cysteine ligase CoaBC [[Haemophilus] felis]OOS05192.1 bifunctional phosphopantothenoylcysteine decarboxylase/phosphopantothenate synthase [[Haemophilus] felis]
MDSQLVGKRILVGITGGIAAYKTIELIRLLRKNKAEVRVVLTPAATEFVTPLTLQAISGNPVAQSLLDPQAELAMGHIELAKWADMIVVAPASADFIARLTVGMADDLLSTVCLASSAPILLAPAMNQQMFSQTITQQNIRALQQRQVQFVGPNVGEQACGDVGAGRMSEPAEIHQKISELLSEAQDLLGVKVAITAGPTREAIDPVRYISNHSSGKMGFAIAEAFAERGATVTLISGPVNLPSPLNVHRIDVISAEQMQEQALMQAVQSHIFVGCAAVADYRVANIAEQKIKKAGDEIQLTLVKNPDIIAEVGHLSVNRPFTVGFAAETENLEQYAKDKLQRKKLDMICANDVSSGQVFNAEENSLRLFWSAGGTTLPLTDKRTLAKQLVNQIMSNYQQYYVEK